MKKKTNTNIPQQIAFTGKVYKYDGATMLSLSEKQQQTISNFYLDSFIVTQYKQWNINKY